jgi:hypothetical protein
MENKQTAVEWLNYILGDYGCNIRVDIDWKTLDGLIDQAKAMEKQQIIEANEDASTNEFGEFLTGEQYYNETYGK